MCLVPVGHTGRCWTSRSGWCVCVVPVVSFMVPCPRCSIVRETAGGRSAHARLLQGRGKGKGRGAKDGREEQGTTSLVAQQTSTLLYFLALRSPNHEKNPLTTSSPGFNVSAAIYGDNGSASPRLHHGLHESHAHGP